MDTVTTAALVQKVAADTERLIPSARDEYKDALISDKISDVVNFLTPSVPLDRPESLVNHLKRESKEWIDFYNRKGALTNDVEVLFEVAVDQMLKEHIERIVKADE
ncbi:hypothetical protein HK104_010852 [Borealophlyctis nickersoniae]|nr:hypothetical protein HK104_010852 [Borealophlyctis nickersoniae]